MADTLEFRKQCSKCGVTKPLSEYCKSKDKPMGVSHRCGSCAREDDRARDCTPERLEKSKKYQATKRGKELSRIRERTRRQEAHEIVRAGELARKAIKKGILVRQPCEICGADSIGGHHDDYGKPLEVQWLCQRHHSEVHRRA